MARLSSHRRQPHACVQLRHRRTRVSLVPIEIDPNAEMDFAEAPATLANTAASVLCHPGRPQPALDF